MRSATLLVLALVAVATGAVRGDVPLPNARQLDFMEMEMVQFMHFGIPTFWDPPEEYLYTANPTYHDCKTTVIDHSNQTGSFYPCLDPVIFNPTNLSADDWMANSAALGMKEICLTAHHEGGFALWPTKFSNYSVKLSTRYKGGNGDVLREFADAANRWGINICYYLNVQDDGYQTLVAKATPEEFIERQVGMVREVLTEYGPVNRFWFDGTHNVPAGTNLNELWRQVYQTIREVSPATLISSYRGDVCASIGTLYTNNGPPPNSSDTSNCQQPSEAGKYFHPTEMHGITIQEGPDGNSDALPTFWFWHPWACAGNVSGCPWIGHANASRIFDSYLVTVGHGAVLNMNIPPERTGRMNASVAAVMREAGKAINDTFGPGSALAQLTGASQHCGTPLELALPRGGGQAFDYVVTMEDLRFGQRIANYSIDYEPVGSPGKWLTLVPPVVPKKPHSGGLRDRPDGHDPRDQYVGHKRIDIPVVVTNGTGPAPVQVARIRFNCLKSIAAASDGVFHLRSLSLHKKTVPWEEDK